MEQEKMKKRVREIDSQISDLNIEKNRLMLALAEMNCPYRVGDRITWLGAGGEYEITGIRDYYTPGDWKIIGSKIKKNGDPGAVISRIWVPADRSKVKVVSKC